VDVAWCQRARRPGRPGGGGRGRSRSGSAVDTRHPASPPVRQGPIRVCASTWPPCWTGSRPRWTGRRSRWWG